MYRVEGSYKYACQMCHEPVATFEKCQLSTGMEKELDAMYLCMCPNCASEYRRMRSDEYDLQEFLEKITYLDEQEEDTEAEVVVEGTDVYKEYIGKRVLHKSVGYGVVRTCDGKYLGIEFEEGPKAGKITNYSLEACLSKGLIQIV